MDKVRSRRDTGPHLAAQHSTAKRPAGGRDGAPPHAHEPLNRAAATAPLAAHLPVPPLARHALPPQVRAVKVDLDSKLATVEVEAPSLIDAMGLLPPLVQAVKDLGFEAAPHLEH